MNFVALLTVIVLFEYGIFSLMVGIARGRTGVDAPAINGNEEFERYFRVQQNTLERLIMFLPALWIFSYYINPIAGVSIGAFFAIGRLMYFLGYTKDAKKRVAGFLIGEIAINILLIGSVIGIVMSILSL